MADIIELRNISKLVKGILETDPQSRNSDDYLYYRVCFLIGNERNNVIIHTMDAANFFLFRSDMGYPAFETVRRTRQRMQHLFPELKADTKVKDFRQNQEGVFNEYATEV